MLLVVAMSACTGGDQGEPLNQAASGLSRARSFALGGHRYVVACQPVSDVQVDVKLPHPGGGPLVRAVAGVWSRQAVAVLETDPQGCGLWSLAIAEGLSAPTRSSIESEVQLGVESFGVVASPVPKDSTNGMDTAHHHEPSSTSPSRGPSSLASDGSGGTASASDGPVRDIGPLVGFREHESSYVALPGDIDGDGWPDIFIGHHGSRPAELFLNEPDGSGGSLGFALKTRFIDDLHDRPDRHGCILGDVNLDGLVDFFCEKGAQVGTAEKWNELWIEGPAGTWKNQAHAWGVEDHWGRGRYPTWIDLNHDRWPDLFMGNAIPRFDNHITPDRTFINEAGKRFRQVSIGVTRQIGGGCAQAADVNRDGWDDLVVCGQNRLFLFVRRGDHFENETAAYGVPSAPAVSDAELVDLTGDGVLDLVVVRQAHLEIRLGSSSGHLDTLMLRRQLQAGHGLVIGNIDGVDGPDVLAVEGCDDRVNVDDVLLLNSGDGRSWHRVPVPSVSDGCGDTGTSIDFDRDGKDEFVVLNGGGPEQPLDLDGPDQLLTMGDWRPAP